MSSSHQNSGHARKLSHQHEKKKEEPPEVATVEYEVPDGGYGWVIVVCAFVFIAMPMGVSASFAIYYEEWIDYFNAGTAQTSLVGSVGSGCVPLLGSLGGMILTNLFNDVRLVGIIGCVISATGLVLSYFVYDINLLAFTYGALGGFGMGLMYNCAYLSVGYYFDKNRAFATALASSGTGFGTLISRVIRLVIEVYGWRGSLLILAAICAQCLIFAALIRPLYAKKVKKAPMAAVEEVIPKISEQMRTTSADEKEISKFSSHEGIFESRRMSLLPSSKRTFSSHMHIGHIVNPHHDKALRHRTGDIKLNPYNREDIFFSGSTYDIEKIQGKTAKTEQDFGSQITIDSIPVSLTGCAKIKSNLKKNFDLKIFKSLTFCLVVLAMTLHHMAFFVPYTYIISLTREKGIKPATSEYLIICFGMSNFVNKLWIGRVMTHFKVEQLYVVVTTLLIGSLAATMVTFCEEFYQFVIVAILYGGTSPIVTIYVTNILVKYLGIENLTNAFSIVTIIRGLGSLSGPPLAGVVIEMTNMTRAAFYVGSCADICSATLFGLIIFVNRKRPTNQKDSPVPSSNNGKHDHDEEKDSGVDEDENLLKPKIIVSVPTAEGNIDKMIHYSNPRFDHLAARDQVEHSRRMKQRIEENVAAIAGHKFE